MKIKNLISHTLAAFLYLQSGLGAESLLEKYVKDNKGRIANHTQSEYDTLGHRVLDTINSDSEPRRHLDAIITETGLQLNDFPAYQEFRKGKEISREQKKDILTLLDGILCSGVIRGEPSYITNIINSDFMKKNNWKILDNNSNELSLLRPVQYVNIKNKLYKDKRFKNFGINFSRNAPDFNEGLKNKEFSCYGLTITYASIGQVQRLPLKMINHPDNHVSISWGDIDFETTSRMFGTLHPDKDYNVDGISYSTGAYFNPLTSNQALSWAYHLSINLEDQCMAIHLNTNFVNPYIYLYKFVEDNDLKHEIVEKLLSLDPNIVDRFQQNSANTFDNDNIPKK